MKRSTQGCPLNQTVQIFDRCETHRVHRASAHRGARVERRPDTPTRPRVSAFIVFLSASIASRADAVVRRRIAPAARDRTRGVDTFRFTKVLSKPTTVSRLEHVVRGRMKRARRGDGRQALVATFAAALVAISIAPLRARAAPFPADGANLKSAINNCLAADATGACDCSSSSVDCKQGNGIAIGSWDTSQVTQMEHPVQSSTAFNQDISAWNTAEVTTMDHMFYQRRSLQPGHLCLEHGEGDDTCNTCSLPSRSLQPGHLCLEHGGGDDTCTKRVR